MARILYVDDEEAIRLLSERVLGAAGHEVITASGGLEAITKLKEQQDQGKPIDLVISDYDMPEQKGDDLISAMRTQEYYQPVIGVTGLYEVNGPKFMQAGAILVLAKPFDCSELTRLTYELVGSNGHQA